MQRGIGTPRRKSKAKAGGRSSAYESLKKLISKSRLSNPFPNSRNRCILYAMEHNMILSASGWRKVFAESGNEEDHGSSIGAENRALAALAAHTFAKYLLAQSQGHAPVVAVGMDTRPTGKEIADAVVKVLLGEGLSVRFLGISAAPEIMAYARTVDAFLYISASHNPIGHNGIKFGKNDGGVLPAGETKKLAAAFEAECRAGSALQTAEQLMSCASEAAVQDCYDMSVRVKGAALQAYTDFMRTVITGTVHADEQDAVLAAIQQGLSKQQLSILCDMNGSARTVSIDKTLLPKLGVQFLPFNNEPGTIPHAIIPEPENLMYCAAVMQDLQIDGDSTVQIGYMPDCDGDRGNIVLWDTNETEVVLVSAQDVFALCVMAECTFEQWKRQNVPGRGLLWKAQSRYGRHAVVANGPTSMRTDAICAALGIEMFRAEVGEANVVNLARQKRNEGYTVRIMGEGSNGGNITHPSSVRDPVATVTALLKVLALRDGTGADGTLKKGLFHLWCDASGQGGSYKDDFTLIDVLKTLPGAITTGVSEDRAILRMRTADTGLLKERFQRLFVSEWEQKKADFQKRYGFVSYEADTTNGTEERRNIAGSWNNGSGGLKIRFIDAEGKSKAFIWMRPSGTEPVFRIMCDVAGCDGGQEHALLQWERDLLAKADGES